MSDGNASSPRVTIPGYDRAKRKRFIEEGLIVPLADRPAGERALVEAGASPEPRYVYELPYLASDRKPRT